jgi:3-oxoacyl-[acyl-carrier protein] reductase
MIHGRGGTIVNISSRGAFRGESSHPAEGASKAIIALGPSLARALGAHDIVATAVAPGFVETEWLRMLLPARAARSDGREPPGADRDAGGGCRGGRVPRLGAATMASSSVLDVNGTSYLRM